MTSVIRRWNGTAWVDVLVNTDTIADGAVTAAKLSAPVVPLAGGTMTGPLTVQLSAASAAGVYIPATSAAPSEKAMIILGGYQIGQDSGSTGVKDFFITDTVSSQYRLLINPAGEVGLGTFAEAGFKVKINGNTKILTGAGVGDAGLTIIETTHATSKRASVVLGGWQVGQDYTGQGATDFFIYDATAGTHRMLITNTGEMGIGTTPESGFTLKLGWQMKTGAGDKMLRIPEDPGASARASMVIGDWEIGQDVAGNNVKDWYLYGLAGLTATAQTGGSFYFKQLSSGISLNYRRGGAIHAGTWTRSEFHKFGRRVMGSGRVAITDIATGTGEIDVTFAGLGTPVYVMPCGNGAYFDSDGGAEAYIPLTVWVHTNPVRFYFFRQDAMNNGFQPFGLVGGGGPGTNDQPGTNCANDWLEFEFCFPVTTDF